ncbi:hypothetical protein ACH79_33395 [Bradyrhizobium sp. CCBAU 051011]|uniref:AAA family ATPase n=1 Tax=Bradyrhizobium sp. CCBAU 051011 TaxID=858422 RepID=UPI00137381B7|nr:AAA family ATPase [Bradyrhizobium sp. CCBAU 051011]QHO76801.1 hypothetical protein ACH79_33395 [Bradyrhizobium sp. CCBAU 051011]
MESNRQLDAQILRLDARASTPERLRRTNTVELMARTFDPLKWVVPGYLSEGFLVLAGRQKLGKTWLAIDMALAVATGGVAMGSIMCEQGDVLYIDLENGERRIQSRIKTLFPNERDRPDLSRLEWATEPLRLDGGLLELLDRWRLEVPAPRLVVIDVLQRIKPPGNRNQNAYESDYSTWAPLQKWATEHGIAVLGLHHTKKGGADDPLEALSGSNGLSACADTTLVLDANQNGKTLYVRGRDVDEKETALLFAGGFWTILGEAAEVRRSDERSQIIAALQDHGDPMTPAEIVAATGKPRVSVQRLLGKMAKAGEVHKVGKSRYWLEPMPPGNSGHTGNTRSNTIAATAEIPDEPVTDLEEAGNTGNFIDEPHVWIDGKPARQAAALLRSQFTPEELGVDVSEVISNRHKCDHCWKRGETLEVHHGGYRRHLHRYCIDRWIADYEERNADAGE